MLSTFQTIVLAGIESLTRLFPLGTIFPDLLPKFLDWPGLPMGYQGLIEIELAIALLWFQRHEWLSQLAALIQILAYRRKPMTMDERIPFYVLVVLLPVAFASPWITEQIPVWGGTSLQITGYPVLVGVILGWMLVLAGNFSRRKWALYDWKLSSAIFLGITLLASAVPGMDLITLGWTVGFLLNHRADSVGRMVYWVASWTFLVSGVRKLGDLPVLQAANADQMSRLSFYAGLAVAGVLALAVARSLRGWTEKEPHMKRFAFLRTALLALFLIFVWYHH